MLCTVFIIIFSSSFTQVKGKINDSSKDLYSTSTQLNDEDIHKQLDRSQNHILKDFINKMVLVDGGSFMMDCSNEKSNN